MQLSKSLRFAARSFVPALSFAAALGFVPFAHAAVSSVLFSAGTTCSGAATANFATGGQPVVVSLCMSTTAPTATCGHSIVLQSASGESGQFVVTSRTLGANYGDANSEVVQTPVAINNPPITADFGGTITGTTNANGGSTLTPVAASVNQLLATFEISAQASAANGSYVLSLSPASIVAVDADGACGGTGVAPTETAMNANVTLTRTLTPAFLSVAAVTFAVNQTNNFVVSASGSAPISFSATGLPAGVVISTTGVISGTPTTTGTFPIVITAMNGSGLATQNFVLTVAGQATQTISFANPGSQTFSSTAVALTATASSGLPITFSSLTPFVCGVSGPSVSMITIGTCTVAANQAGNTAYAAAALVTQSFGIFASVPGAPTIGAVAAGNAQASVAFTAPASSGGSPITGYTARCDSFTGSGTSSPIVVSGLSNGTAYNCSVTATNLFGTGAASASVQVTPTANATLALVGVQSRKTHGTAGNFDLPIDTAALVDGNVTVEPRLIGSAHTIVFQFNNPITAASAVTVVDSASAAVGTATVTFAGSEVTVSLTAAAGVLDNKRVKFTLGSVNGSAFPPVSVGFLVGDVNNTRSVTGGDILQVKGRSGLNVDSTNFIYDITVNGTITGADILQVKGRSGQALAP